MTDTPEPTSASFVALQYKNFGFELDINGKSKKFNFNNGHLYLKGKELIEFRKAYTREGSPLPRLCREVSVEAAEKIASEHRVALKKAAAAGSMSTADLHDMRIGAANNMAAEMAAQGATDEAIQGAVDNQIDMMQTENVNIPASKEQLAAITQSSPDKPAKPSFDFPKASK